MNGNNQWIVLLAVAGVALYFILSSQPQVPASTQTGVPPVQTGVQNPLAGTTVNAPPGSLQYRYCIHPPPACAPGEMCSMIEYSPTLVSGNPPGCPAGMTMGPILTPQQVQQAATGYVNNSLALVPNCSYPTCTLPPMQLLGG